MNHPIQQMIAAELQMDFLAEIARRYPSAVAYQDSIVIDTEAGVEATTAEELRKLMLAGGHIQMGDLHDNLPTMDTMCANALKVPTTISFDSCASYPESGYTGMTIQLPAEEKKKPKVPFYRKIGKKKKEWER